MTTEPFVAAEASMCSKNNKIIQFTKATKNRKVALRLKKQKQKQRQHGLYDVCSEIFVPSLESSKSVVFFNNKKIQMTQNKNPFFFFKSLKLEDEQVRFCCTFSFFVLQVAPYLLSGFQIWYR